MNLRTEDFLYWFQWFNLRIISVQFLRTEGFGCRHDRTFSLFVLWVTRLSFSGIPDFPLLLLKVVGDRQSTRLDPRKRNRFRGRPTPWTSVTEKIWHVIQLLQSLECPLFWLRVSSLRGSSVVRVWRQLREKYDIVLLKQGFPETVTVLRYWIFGVAHSQPLGR